MVRRCRSWADVEKEPEESAHFFKEAVLTGVDGGGGYESDVGADGRGTRSDLVMTGV